MVVKIGVLFNIHSLYHSANDAFGTTISYQRLMQEISKDRRVVESRACVIGDKNKQESFLYALTQMKLFPETRPDPEALRDFFAFEMIRIAPRCDTLVVVTNDDSILPIIDYLECTDRKPNVELWYVDHEVSDDLLDGVDSAHKITSNFQFKKKEDS